MSLYRIMYTRVVKFVKWHNMCSHAMYSVLSLFPLSHYLSLSPPPSHSLLDSTGGSGSDTGSDDDEGTTAATGTGALADAQKLQEMAGVDADALSGDAMSEAKQSRSEKKARKAMLKLGLKSHPGQSLSWCSR